MSTSLNLKLQIKPGHRLLVLNPPPGLGKLLASGLKGITLARSGRIDAVLAFAHTLAEARKLTRKAIRLAGDDGLLWIAYPKGSSKMKTDVNRDRLWEALRGTGWRPVRIVALDETWSAMRFRPAQKVHS